MSARIRIASTISTLVACGVSLAAIAQDVPVSAAPRALSASANDAALKWSPCPPPFATGCEIAVLQGDPAKPNADVYFRIPGGYAIPPHAHTSAEHVVLVSGELEVRYRGQDSVTLKAGDYAYGPAGVPHLGRCRSETPCTLFIAFERPVDVLPHQGEF
jgi:quercetin dioxygenase-like cupin family protein